MPPRPGPTREQMRLMAQASLDGLPAPFADACAEIVLDVDDFASAEQLAAVGLDDRWELTGLYEGVPLSERSAWETPPLPSRIWLFREPLIAEWRETGVEMSDLVRHVVVHEAGHHFGLDDEAMHALEDEAG